MGETLKRNIGTEINIMDNVAVTTASLSGDIDMETNGYVAVEVLIDAFFPSTPTDNLVVEVLPGLDGTRYSDIARHKFTIQNDVVANPLGTAQSFVLYDLMHSKIKVYRDGSTDTINVTISYKPWNTRSV